MKTEILTNNFKSMLKVMDKIKDKGSTTDILLKTEGDTTQFIKADSNTTIIYNANNTVDEQGTTIMPVATAELIKKIKENIITITDDAITTDKKNIAFNKPENAGINIYDNDIIPKIFEVTQRELLRMLEVTYAVLKEEFKPALTGTHFNKNETCCCDGYRLSLRKTKEYENTYAFTVNQDSIDILKSILKATDDKVTVRYNNKIVKFEINNISIIAKCIEGEFIHYQSIINTEYDNKSIVDAGELAEEVNFMKSADKRNLVKLVFTDSKITLKGNQCIEKYNEDKSDKDMGKRQIELDYEYNEQYKKWIGKGKKGKQPTHKQAKFKKLYDLVPTSEITINVAAENELKSSQVENGEYTMGFNPNYIYDALKMYDNKVEIRMTRNINPAVISDDFNNDDGLELVLPIRLK